MTTNRMFSPEALKAFRNFMAVDAKTHSKPGSPEGAFDQVTKPLRRAMARDATPPPQKPVNARNMVEDDDGEEYDQNKVNELMEYLQSKLHGSDLQDAMTRLHEAFPNCLDELGEEPEEAGEDDADADWPPANSGGKPHDFANDDPPAFKDMPKPGGTLYGQDSYSRFFPEASHIKEDLWVTAPPSPASLLAMDEGGDDSYLEMFPETARIKNLY